MDEERIRRPGLDRDRPIRNWSTLFGDDGQKPPASGPGEAVSRAVELGYRVIDEYIRQGQKAANRVRQGRYDAETMQSDMEEIAMRMAQYASDFTSLWGELLNRGVGEAPEAAADSGAAGGGTASPGNAPPRPAGAPAPGSAPSPPPAPAPGRMQVRLQVASLRPAEVSIDLQPGAGDRPLTAHSLRAADAESARITEVSFEPATEGAPPTLRLRVPEDQPAGSYHGLLIDPSSNLPVGTVSVRLPEADDPT